MTPAKISRNNPVRVLLVLGRVSNLPTVWSNCLAAWILAGGGKLQSFLVLCIGATLLYTGGMFLNDAFDVEFDRKYRPERPIISGQIALRSVWIIAAALLLLGWLATAWLGKAALLCGSMLLATIVIYDAVHKGTATAPLLMAACRFLLYLLASSAANGEVRTSIVIRAAVLALYIVGLSYFARTESTERVTSRWPALLLFAPILAALFSRQVDQEIVWLVVATQGAWVLWCLGAAASQANHYLPRGIAGLLAGIVLVDWVAAAGSALWLSGVFVALFVLAIMIQRAAPAT
jgi:4-hydroxybenzoate polyprenyltransferase